MTGLKPEEFDFLCDHFDTHWQAYYRHNTLEGRPRGHPAFTEHRNVSLPGTENKLFFLLSYMKGYPLQEFHGAGFNLSQGKVSLWVRTLRTQLDNTLQGLGCAPCTDPERIAARLQELQADTFNLDATERPIGRSTDRDVQQHYYSGKKKTIR